MRTMTFSVRLLVASFLIISFCMTPMQALAVEAAEKKKSPVEESRSERQAEREVALSKMLSGATLEGSYTVSGPGADAAKINREKYTLGDVKKVAGNIWQFPARIEYGGKDATLPIPLRVYWAGDTPMVVVDNVSLPGFGAVSARVLFFDGHYAGYWKHGEHSGNLFGEIHTAGQKKASDSKSAEKEPASSRAESPAGKKP